MSKGERTAAADTVRLRAAPRCGARTRAGTPCRSPAVHGRRRCRMHGCGGGRFRKSGAPRGNRNAWKDGFWAAAARARRREMTAFIRGMEANVAEFETMARSPAPAFTGSFSGAWGCFPLFLSGDPSEHREEALERLDIIDQIDNLVIYNSAGPYLGDATCQPMDQRPNPPPGTTDRSTATCAAISKPMPIC